MDIGDKVRLIKGNPFNGIGIIKSFTLRPKPVNVLFAVDAMKKTRLDKHFLIEAGDGTIFSGFEDQLELVQ